MQMTTAMAVAWAKGNVQVNAIMPGWIDTELTVVMRQAIPGLSERVLPRVPAGALGQAGRLCRRRHLLGKPRFRFHYR